MVNETMYIITDKSLSMYRIWSEGYTATMLSSKDLNNCLGLHFYGAMHYDCFLFVAVTGFSTYSTVGSDLMSKVKVLLDIQNSSNIEVLVVLFCDRS